jgi:hypothetical protein
MPAVALRGRPVNVLGAVDQWGLVPVSLLAAILAGILAAVGCTEAMPPLPRPARRVAGRIGVALTLTASALAVSAVPAALADRLGLDAAALARNVALAFSLTLFVVVTPARAMAWLPVVALFSAETLFGYWFLANPLLRRIILVNPAADKTDLALVGAAWCLAVALFAVRGGGQRTRLASGDRVKRRAPSRAGIRYPRV